MTSIEENYQNILSWEAVAQGYIETEREKWRRREWEQKNKNKILNNIHNCSTSTSTCSLDWISLALELYKYKQQHGHQANMLCLSQRWLFLFRFKKCFGIFFELFLRSVIYTQRKWLKIKSQALELILGLPIVTSVLVFKTADKMQNSILIAWRKQTIANSNRIKSNELN